MARKQATVTIPFEGRDQGKIFVLTEMPASRGERWAQRVLLAMARAGVSVAEGGGMAALAVAGMQAFGAISFEEASMLADELMACVTFIPDPVKFPRTARPLIEEDIEEIRTRLHLKSEVFTLHTGFSFPDAPSMQVPVESGTYSTIQISPGR